MKTDQRSSFEFCSMLCFNFGPKPSESRTLSRVNSTFEAKPSKISLKRALDP